MSPKGPERPAARFSRPRTITPRLPQARRSPCAATTCATADSTTGSGSSTPRNIAAACAVATSAVTATDRIKDGFPFDSAVSLNGNSAEITDGKLKITVQNSRVYVSFGDSLSEISFGDVNDGSDAGLLICRGLTGYEKSDIILVSTDKTDIGDLPSQKVILTSQNGTVLFTLSHNGKMTYRRMA